jgi:hypothetical protein
LLPVEPSDEFVRPADLKNDQSPNRQSSLVERALRALALFLIMLCVSLSAILAWRSYGNMARQMTADLYRQLGWLAPQRAPTAQKVHDTTAVVASAGHSSQEIEEVLSVDHSTIARVNRNERPNNETDANATSRVAAYRAQQQLDADRIAAGQDQMTRSTDQTATIITQAAPAHQARGIAAEIRADGASSQPMMRLNIEPTEARSPQALSEKGKQLSAASGHDSSCFPSASAVLEHHRGGWPSWTLKAPGHEGTVCWYASARPRTSDHRREMTPRKEIVGATENGLPAPPARAGWWAGGLP